MTTRMTLTDHGEIAEEINRIIDDVTRLGVKISNLGGKTRMRSLCDNLIKQRDSISAIRYELEELMSKEYPNAPLYTQHRDYRETTDRRQ